MKNTELFKCYNLSECLNQDEVLEELDSMMDDGKIEYYYEISNEQFKIVDTDLTDKELSNLLDLFYNNDVIPDMDYIEPDEFKDDIGYYEDYE